MSNANSLYGGYESIKFDPTGFFHTRVSDGIHWIVDPEGFVFISKGVNHVSYTADNAPKLGYSPYGRVTARKYGASEAWAKEAVSRMKSWGFNTIGAWSSSETFTQKIAYTVILDIAGRSGGNWQQGTFPDVFSDEFAEGARRIAQESCSPRKSDPFMLGYFTDNELRWGPDWRSTQGLIADFWELPADSAGKKAVVKYVRDYYGTIDRLDSFWKTEFRDFDELQRVSSLKDFGEVMSYTRWGLVQDTMKRIIRDFSDSAVLWYLNNYYGTVDKVNAQFGTRFASFDEIISMKESPIPPETEELKLLESGFLKLVASQYFKVCAEAIREYDPNHLVLGCRYAGYAPDEVVQSMGDNVDIVSYNNYDFKPPMDKLRQIYEWTGKPMMLTEFSFKAMDSGLPNTRGAGQPVQTQNERAEKYGEYVTGLMSLPFMVGFHWFEYADEPAEGRFDGENSNYGLVNMSDDPWEVLTKRMSEINAQLEEIHLKSGK